jgi:hypothetical protein
MVLTSTMDNGKDAWDSFTTDHGSFPLVHVAKHSMVGSNHAWYPHVYGMTMVLSILRLVPTMGSFHISMA